MGEALSILKKVALGGLGAAGLALVAYLVEHGDVPEWLHRLCGWVWALVTAKSEWALWEIFLPVLLIAALAILFLHQEAIKIAQLHAHIEQLSKRLGKSKDRERELVGELANMKPKSQDDLPLGKVVHALSPRQLKLLRLIAKLEQSGDRATHENLGKAFGIDETELLDTIAKLKKTGHIIRMVSASGDSYLLTSEGRKRLISYLSDESAV